MTTQEQQQKAFQIYAILGELSVKRKQMVQQISQVDNKIAEMEQEIIELSNEEIIDDVKEIASEEE